MKLFINTLLSKHWDALLASFTAGCFLYYFTRHSGIGISPDSVSYLSTAEHILRNFSFTDFRDMPLVIFPIGYPLFLAKIGFFTGLSPEAFLPWVNALLLIGVLFMTSFLIQDYLPKARIYKAAILAILACSPGLLEVYSMAWSETVFLFLSLLFITCIRFYQFNRNTGRLLLVALVAAVAFLIRYAGICMVITGIAILLFDEAIQTLPKARQILLFTLIACTPVSLNLIRNHLLAGESTGVREKALRSVMNNLQQSAAVLGDWLPFLKGHATLSVCLLLAIVTLGMAVFIYGILQQQYYHSSKTILGCFLVVYFGFLISIASISRFEDISNRLLSPVYIPLLLIGSSWLPAFYRRSWGFKKILITAGSMLLFGGFLYNHYQQNAAAWEGIKDAGIPGYTEDSWTQSVTIRYINQNKTLFGDTVYSDAEDAVYYLTGLKALPLPHKEIEKEKTTFLQTHQFYLFWLSDGENQDLVGLPFIQQHKQMVSEQIFPDGKLYYFRDSLLHK